MDSKKARDLEDQLLLDHLDQMAHKTYIDEIRNLYRGLGSGTQIPKSSGKRRSPQGRHPHGQQ